MCKDEFMGDVLLISTPDGADIELDNGLVKDCRNFDTAVYLSLLGGNDEDLNRRPKETWWGNLIEGTQTNEWITSEFGAMIKGYPLTSGNLRKAKDACKRDLNWIINDAGADEIDVELTAESAQRVKLDATVSQDGSKAGGGNYELQWQGAVR